MAWSSAYPTGQGAPRKASGFPSPSVRKRERQRPTHGTPSEAHQVRDVIRGKDGAEGEVRMVVEGFLREAIVTGPCQREGSKPPATRSSSPKGRTVTSSTPRLSAPQRSSG